MTLCVALSPIQIVAACDFYMYIGHIRQGIIKQDSKLDHRISFPFSAVHSSSVAIATRMYWQLARLRAVMSLARLSLAPPNDTPPPTAA